MNAKEPVFKPYTTEACDIDGSRPDAKELCVDEETYEGLDYGVREGDPSRPKDTLSEKIPRVPSGLAGLGSGAGTGSPV